MTDENSGIAERIDAYFLGTDSFRRSLSIHIYSEGKLKPEGGDLYSVEFIVSEFLSREKFVLQQVTVYDNAGNTGNLWAGGFVSEGVYHGEKFYKQKTGGPSPKVVYVNITGSGQRDIVEPRFLEIRKADSDWETGSSQRVYVRIQDAGSGLDLGTLSSTTDGLMPAFTLSGYFLPLKAHSPRAEGGDWYSVAVDIPSLAPSGQYLLRSLGVKDKAGNYGFFNALKLTDKNYYTGSNSTKIPLFKVMVRNRGQEDRLPPSIEEVRVDSSVWKVGETQRIHIRSRDNISGINLDAATYKVVFAPSFKRGESNRFLHKRWIWTESKLEAEGNDWYGVDIKVDPYLPADTYFLESALVMDNAGIGNILRCSDHYPDYKALKACKNQNGPALPVLQVKVVP